jgi:hypothetical protein
MKIQEKNLPRWAQSVIRDSAIGAAASQLPPQQIKHQAPAEDLQVDIEDVFENTLEKVGV